MAVLQVVGWHGYYLSRGPMADKKESTANGKGKGRFFEETPMYRLRDGCAAGSRSGGRYVQDVKLPGVGRHGAGTA